MNQRLLAAVGVYGVALPLLAVGGVFAGLRFVGEPFGPVGVLTVIVGLMAGPVMFARAGSGPAAADTDGDGMNTFDEPERTAAVGAASDTALKTRVGLFALGAAGVSALLLAL